MLFSLKGLAVSLTVHSAKNQRPYAIEFHTRCQVEVLFGILVNLTENKRFPFKMGFQINANTWIVSEYFGIYNKLHNVNTDFQRGFTWKTQTVNVKKPMIIVQHHLCCWMCRKGTLRCAFHPHLSLHHFIVSECFMSLLSAASSADRGWLIVYYWLRRRVECFVFARVYYLHRDNVCQSTDGNNMQLSVGQVLHFAPQYLCIFAAVQSVPHL